MHTRPIPRYLAALLLAGTLAQIPYAIAQSTTVTLDGRSAVVYLPPVDGYPETRQSGGKGIAQNYGFARHGGLERSPKGEFQDPHGVAAQFSGCGVVICV